MIGIDTNTWLVFEGVSKHGRGLWPTPVITQAKLIESDEDWNDLPRETRIDDAKLVFREDSFDPVTRVRRGRLYERHAGQEQPTVWSNGLHPADPTLYVATAGRVKQSLVTFHPLHLFGLRLRKSPRMLLVLGHNDAPTVWRILSAERTPSGEDLITLRARSSFGALPELDNDKMPADAVAPVAAILDKVVDASFRAGPESIIDMCRAAFTVVLSHWLAQEGEATDKLFTDDVGDLLKRIETRYPGDSQMAALKASVRLLQRFHSRGKPNEQVRYNTRPPNEDDAELVLQAFGFIVREIGWAR